MMRLSILALVVPAIVTACAATPTPPSGRVLDDAAVRTEILELHEFFEGWFSGRLEQTPTAFARFDGVIGDEFVLVSPGGQRMERVSLAPFLDAAYRSHVDDGFRIWIENVHVRAIPGGYALATYEEWQDTTGGAPRGRLSSALFCERVGTPNGLEWVHVHETWLPEPEPPTGP